MPIRLKKLIGMFLLVALVIIYALVASIFAVARLSESGALVQFLFFLFIALCAQLTVVQTGQTIPLIADFRIQLANTPVPITGQTFAVLLVGGALGARRGVLADLAAMLPDEAVPRHERRIHRANCRRTLWPRGPPQSAVLPRRSRRRRAYFTPDGPRRRRQTHLERDQDVQLGI